MSLFGFHNSMALTHAKSEERRIKIDVCKTREVNPALGLDQKTTTGKMSHGCGVIMLAIYAASGKHYLWDKLSNLSRPNIVAKC